MAVQFSTKKNNRSLYAKIIVTCLLAGVTILLSLYTSRFTFRRILTTVDQLSRPNVKIQLVNNLFRDVVTLDQLQRDQALKNEINEYNPLLRETEHLQSMLDMLRGMSLQNPAQLERIDSMKRILSRRDTLFVRYLRLNADLRNNDTLTSQVEKLSGMIEKAALRLDSNSVTSNKKTKTTIDTLKNDNDETKQTLWRRIFNNNKRKKHAPVTVQKKVEEELKVRVDTMALGNKGHSVAAMSKAISKAEMKRISRRTQLLNGQIAFNHAGELLISQLMSILNDIERDELAHAVQQNKQANHVVNKGIVQINIILVFFILGTIVLVALIFTDIARSNRYRKELIVAKDEAEQAGLVKQRFLANMSHELRTPLQTIIGVSEQVRAKEYAKPGELENIYQSSLHLLQIVNEVLDYSRIVSGKFMLDNKPFNMYRVISEVQEMIQVQTDRKGLDLVCAVNVQKDQYYTGDPFRLKQVLLNLMGNATKFTDSGSVSLIVNENPVGERDSSFTFIIKDTGTGMTADDLKVIFNQFEQGSNSHRQQGTGLGLNIVKALVELQKGNISVTSTPGKGSEFIMTLPYPTTDSPMNAPATAAADIPATGYEGHVWVVDDDLFILQLCDSILDVYNIKHTCFSSANEVLATPFPESLGIVFMDIRMPEMDGITLCGKLKERATAIQPQFIALTAQALPDERETIMQKGFDGLLMKPFLEQDLIEKIYTTTLPGGRLSDLTAVRKMASDDPAMLKKALQSFIRETEKDITALRQCVKANSTVAIADTLHKLAGRCAQFGALPLAAKLRNMENTLREHGQTPVLKADIEDIYNSLAALLAEIKGLQATT